MPSIVGLVMLAAAPAMSAAGEVTLSTPFPAIAVAPGSAPSFEISVTTQEPGRVSLSVGSILAAHALPDADSLRPVDAPWVDRPTAFARRKLRP